MNGTEIFAERALSVHFPTDGNAHRTGHRPRQREIARQATQLLRPTAAGTLSHTCHRRVFHQRSRRALLRLKTNRISHTQPVPSPLAYDPAPYRNRPVLGPLQDESQPMQVVQATAPPQAEPEPFQDKLPDSFPIPVGQFDARRGWRLLHRPFQPLLLRLVRCGGNHRSARISGLQALPHRRPTPNGLWYGARSSASAVATAVQPRASIQRAYQRARARGVGAKIIRWRRSLTPICHCSRDRSISLTPILNPS